jgi:hypothetical protein
MRYFLLTLSVILLFLACSKKPKTTATVENILRTGKWKLSAATVTVRKPNGKDTTLNYLNFIPGCYKDDYLEFDSLNYGKRYTGDSTCSAAEPLFYPFAWQLKNNNSMMSLYNGFNYVFGIVDTVQPYHADTLSQVPYLVLDTVAGMGTLDTTLPPKLYVEIDTVRELRFSGVVAGQGNTGPAIAGFNITDGYITNFSQQSFELHFQLISYYDDSTKWHSASILQPLDDIINPDSFGVRLPDTFNYTFTYSNF